MVPPNLTTKRKAAEQVSRQLDETSQPLLFSRLVP
jgi:hypothetical protein